MKIKKLILWGIAIFIGFPLLLTIGITISQKLTGWPPPSEKKQQMTVKQVAKKEKLEKQRAITKLGWTATYTLPDYKKAWEATDFNDATTLSEMALKGHLIELPVGEEVYITQRRGDFVELKFIKRTTHPDVWTHKDAVEIQEEVIVHKLPENTISEEPLQFVIAKIACNIRGGPGTKYPIVRKANKGERFDYISLEGNWYKLKVAKGRPQEWVHKSVVTQSPQVVNQITVKGKLIKVGDLADDVFRILMPEDTQGQEVTKDPKNPRSLVVTKYYRVEGKAFALVLKRIKDPGPYRVEKIILHQLSPKSSTSRK